MYPNYSERGAAVSFQVGAIKAEGVNPNRTPAPFTSLQRTAEVLHCAGSKTLGLKVFEPWKKME